MALFGGMGFGERVEGRWLTGMWLEGGDEKGLGRFGLRGRLRKKGGFGQRGGV